MSIAGRIIAGLGFGILAFVSGCNSGSSETGAAVEGDLCNTVLGFSQTRQWFYGLGNFAGRSVDGQGVESTLADANWQLLWFPGAGIESWQDPDFSGWQQSVQSPCEQNATQPQRVFLNISSDLELGDDVSAWQTEIELALITMKDLQWPSVAEVVLMPVVGGVDGGVCDFDGEPVRASVNFPVIVAAIGRVVQNPVTGLEVVAGPQPTVSDCNHYKDSQGHLTEPGALAAMALLANGLSQY